MNTPPLPWGLRARLFFCFLLWVLIGFWALSPSRAQELPVYESQVVVVQVEPGVAIVEGAAKTGLEVFDRTAARYGVHTIERVFPFLDYVQPTPKTRQNLLALRHTYYVRYSAGDDPERVAKVLTSAPGVIYAEPVIINRLLESEIRVEPDDSLFSDQTYLRHMRLPEAWDIVKGEDMSPPVVIAIVDDGSDWQHEDLLANVWTNANEIPDNGIDDDNNGFIDDVHGVNFCNRDDTNNDPFEPTLSGHGTRVAGTAGGVTNNGVGVAGAAWNAQLMHTCGLSYSGVLYAAANGADIINASWSGGSVQPSAFITQSLDLATDMGALVVAAAGNANLNSDVHRFYPSSHPRVLSVGATAKDSRIRASFSNYGKTVNVFAPGIDIITTALNDEYTFSASGTSFSTPLVSGVAALVKTRYPDILPDALREQIRLASGHIDAENPGQAGQLGRGYVNAEASLKMPVVPALRLKSWTWDDTDGDRMIMSGEEVTIKAVFVNHLSDAQELSIGLTGAESYPYIDLSNAEQTVGRVARGDSTEVTLQFAVANDAPSSRPVRFYTQIRDGAFVDEPDQLSFGINTRIELVHAALSALYTSTGGDNWRENSYWDITTVPTPSELARWYGVVVSHGILSRLYLCSNHLTGTLPSELGNLQGLIDLWLCNNSISGEIPSELGNLSQLQILALENNALSGKIPHELGSLSQLRSLGLGGNSLTGEIPRELGNLSQLQYLSLWANALSGEIPPELGNLMQLKSLFLFHNSLSGEIPHELGNLTQLRVLHLNANSLTGEIPPQLGNLSQLQGLEVESNSLSGEIPHELGNLSRLHILRLGGNSLSGEIPPELGNLTQLERLSLDDNSLTGEIPRELGNLTQMLSLRLQFNSLTGEIPRELGNLTRLQTLILRDNALSGEIPHELGNLTQLQWLALWSNSLSGEIPHELGNLSQLQYLNLHDNSLTGEIPHELGNIPQLQSLFLHHNSLTGKIPSELGNLTQLQRLDLDHNFLTGEIPGELGNLTQLQRLELNVNSLTGEIPHELGNLLQLQVLNLKDNSFTGGIPHELGNIPQLQRLSLSYNSLSGEIPHELGNLTQLHRLELDRNLLTGEIPRELGNLSQLQYLSLSFNSLSGEIPVELGSLTQLQGLELSGNSLSGEIPHELSNLSQLQSLGLNANSLTGEIPSELGNLAQLQRLELSGNSLSGEISHELSNLSQLQSLGLNANSLTGEIPSELGNLTQLQRLSLTANSFTGEIPHELGNLSKLQSLHLGDNLLTGEIPSELGNLSQLTQLYLHDNAFTGRLPRSLMQLTNLELLHFSGQDLCAPGDDAFQVWLNNIPHKSGPTCSGVHFIDRVADQLFPRGQPIDPVVLPEAVGASLINYTLTPTLPTGLAFDEANRTLSGLPTVVTPATPYTYKATDANGSTDSLSFSIEVYSRVNAEHESLPEAFALHGNFPNPFRHTTQLMMDLPWPAQVTVDVIDVIGRRVLTAPSTDLTAGWQRSVNLTMAALPSGLYLYRVHASFPGGRVVHAGRFVHVR